MDRQPTDPTEGHDAAFDPSAAEQYEGAPAASAAPDDDSAPPQDETPQVDWQAEIAAREARAAAAEQRAQQLEAERQQLMFQASQQAWEQERQQAHAHAATLDYEPAQQYLAQFYADRERRLMGWAQQATAAVWINQHADDVMRRYGLGPEDRIRLGSDPQQMEANAQWIVNERTRNTAEVDGLRKELTALKRQMAAQGALGNPAYRTGGTRPNGTPPTELPAGSLEKLAAILNGPPAMPQRR